MPSWLCAVLVALLVCVIIVVGMSCLTVKTNDMSKEDTDE